MNQSNGNDDPASERAGERWLTADEATALLGVKRATLYAYVSRGKVRSRDTGKRARAYLESDLRRLKVNTEARAGHRAVAAGALLFGEPVMDSAITRLDAEGPHYRGRSAVELARDGASFEWVRELLFHGVTDPLDDDHGSIEAPPLSRLAALVPDGARPVDAVLLALPAFSVRDQARFDEAPAATFRVARRIGRALIAAFALPGGARQVHHALDAPSLAEVFVRAFSLDASTEVRALVERSMIVCADHELNASSFTCRVTASSGADLYASVLAGMCTLTGPRHGGMSERVAALVDEIGAPGKATRVVRDRLRRGESIPGFGHPIYPEGDPRGPYLLAEAERASPRERRVRVLAELVDAQDLVGAERPTLDIGLVAVAAALGLPPGGASALFAAGRWAGWIAHGFEQRAAGHLLRPRARYVGV